jgi:hypothetical protein
MHEMTLDEMIKCLEGDAEYWGSCAPDRPEYARQMYCIARYLKRLKWLPITEEQRSPTVDGDLLLCGVKSGRVGVGNNHGGAWEIPFLANEFTDVTGWEPTHYMELGFLPPVPKETTPNDN